MKITQFYSQTPIFEISVKSVKNCVKWQSKLISQNMCRIRVRLCHLVTSRTQKRQKLIYFLIETIEISLDARESNET